MKRILISACLLGVNCKYSGGNNLCPQALALRERYELVPVCPEQLGGLSTPRPPAERQGARVATREGLSTPRPPAERQGARVATREGRDVTQAYQKGAEEALRLFRLFSCQAAVLKARSPSCGKGCIYDGSFSGTLVPGSGVTAELLTAQGIPVYTEEELDALPL